MDRPGTLPERPASLTFGVLTTVVSRPAPADRQHGRSSLYDLKPLDSSLLPEGSVHRRGKMLTNVSTSSGFVPRAELASSVSPMREASTTHESCLKAALALAVLPQLKHWASSPTGQAVL